MSAPPVASSAGVSLLDEEHPPTSRATVNAEVQVIVRMSDLLVARKARHHPAYACKNTRCRIRGRCSRGQRAAKSPPSSYWGLGVRRGLLPLAGTVPGLADGAADGTRAGTTGGGCGGGAGGGTTSAAAEALALGAGDSSLSVGSLGRAPSQAIASPRNRAPPSAVSQRGVFGSSGASSSG